MMIRRACAICTVGACLATAACSSAGKDSDAPNIANPSGDCVAPDDGGRPGYHSPAGDTWLPDCNLELHREYWRVFAQSEQSAYLIPRPDGYWLIVEACNDATLEIQPLLEQYQLCSSADNPAQVAAINDMKPVDALAIASFLHSQLVFETDSELAGVSPYPLKSDVRDACELSADPSAELTEICDQVGRSLEQGTDIGIDYSGPAAAELAALLNELYGIDA